MGGENNYKKILAQIILDENLENVIAFGNDCDSYIQNNPPNSYNHFTKIKMNLYHKQYKIKSQNQDKEIDIEKLISLMLKKIKEKTIEQIRGTYPLLKEENVKFILTVPAIWEYKSKQIMINSAKNAGLLKNEDISNFFALEPEAASIYYNIDCDDYAKIIKVNHPFILCDIGSGTVDIVVQEKVEKNGIPSFKELHHPVGGDYGSNKINELIIENIFEELFEYDTFRKLNQNKEKVFLKWKRFEEAIEKFKISHLYNSQAGNRSLLEKSRGDPNAFRQLRETGTIINYYTIDCKLFKKYCSNKSIKNIVDRYIFKNSLKILDEEEWEITFLYILIDIIMETISDEIIFYITHIPYSILRHVKALVFSGGASRGDVLCNKIEKKLRKSNFDLIL